MNLICLFPTKAGTRQLGGIGLDIVPKPGKRVQSKKKTSIWDGATDHARKGARFHEDSDRLI
jgi:hypothetical protein